MDSYVTRQQVRGINRKLFANDIIYSDSGVDTLQQLIASIVQRYDPDDEIAGVPFILEIKENNLTEATFQNIMILNKDSVLIQINSTILAIPEKVDIIKKIKEAGYKVVVAINKEDKVFTLAKIFADIVKFDINALPENVFNDRNAFTCKKLASNVNTADDYVLAEKSGIDYYEGTYISHPSNVEIDRSDHLKVNFIEIIAKINEDTSDAHSIGKIIARDSLMSAQIIRLANSVYFGALSRIKSIDDAVVRVGMNNLKKWILLLEFANNQNVPEELLQTSYHRAVFCEQIVKESGIKGITIGDAYMIGLFSTLDILTGRSIDIELSKMNLSETVENALIYRDGIGGTLLNLIKAYEEANWKRVDKYIAELEINKSRIYDVYYRSTDEVARLWRSLTEHGEVK